MNKEGLKIIGTAARRVDGVDKVTGQAKYTGDIIVPAMVEGKFLRSPFAHARIVSIDTKEAERVRGVVAVLTGKGLSDIDPYLGREKRKDQPRWQRGLTGGNCRDRPGGKGMGEGGIIPVAPAVANAIAWSTGARIKELPLTPEKVWRALREVSDETKETGT